MSDTQSKPKPYTQFRFPVNSLLVEDVQQQNIPYQEATENTTHIHDLGISMPAAIDASTKHVERKRKKLLGIVSAMCILALVVTAGVAYIYHKLIASSDVTLYRVRMQTVSEPIGAGGVVYPNQRLDISYPSVSRVTSVLVKPGDHVSLNQPVVQLDFSQINSAHLLQLNAQVQQAYQDMLSAQAYLNSVTAVGNSVVIAQAQQSYVSAQNKYKSLVAEAATPALHQGVLVSSLTGTVTKVNVYPGQVFDANKVMLTVYDESSVIVHVMVPLANLKQVHVGQSAQVTPAALSAHSYAGKVFSIIRDSDTQTDTFQIWILVKNPHGDFVTGMSTFVQLQNNVKALVLPRLAVLNPDRDSIVYVVRSQHAYIQHVQVTGYVGDTLLIGSGLSINDTVVLVGLNALQNGQAVNITSIKN